MKHLPYATLSLFVVLVGCTPAVAGTTTTTGSGGQGTSTVTTSTASSSAATSSSTGGCVDSARIEHAASENYLEVWPTEHKLVVAADVGSIDEVDTCPMTLLPPTASLGQAYIRGLSRLGNIVAAGTSTNNTNSVEYFDASTLAPAGSLAIPATDGGIWDGAGDGTALWLALDGPAGAGGALFRAPPPPALGCDIKVGLTTGSLARGIAFYKGLPVVGVHGSTPAIATIPGCDLQTCKCGAPIVSSALPSGFDPWSIAVLGDKAYVVGISGLTTSSGAGGLYRIDLPSGTVEASLTWDPTPGTTQAVDGFSSVAVLGSSSVVVVGGQGVAFMGGSAGNPLTLQSGSAVALIYPVDFTSTTKPTKTATLAPGIAWNVATDGTSIFASGIGTGTTPSGFIAKCTADLTCAP